MYTPDRWVVVKIGETLYKVLSGWSGGYLDGDSWRMNSGIESIEETKNYYKFKGYTGSIYKCHKESYGVNTASAMILSKLLEDSRVTLVEEEDIKCLVI